MQVKQAITINGAPEELYRFWRDFQNLPRFMKHLESVRQAILACRNGGTVSVPGVYGGFDDKISDWRHDEQGLTIKTGQTHVQRYFGPLLERIKQGEIDPSFIITHRMRLEDAPKGFDIFTNKEDGCIKICAETLKTGMSGAQAVASDAPSRGQMRCGCVKLRHARSEGIYAGREAGI